MKNGRSGRVKGPLLAPEPLAKALLSKVRDLPHTEVAAMAGCSAYTISKAWTGRYYGLSLRTLRRLADSLGYEIVVQPKSDPQLELFETEEPSQ